MTTLDGGDVTLERTGDEWLLTAHDGMEGAAVVLTYEMLVQLLVDAGLDLLSVHNP